nr:hypothetical protein Caab_038 [Calliteara abietis nucleopolyhedrovirus]
MRRTAAILGAAADPVLDFDQLQQLVARNHIFLRDFILILCCILLFVIITVFIVLVLIAASSTETRTENVQQERERLLANLDYRYVQ